ncbi:MAG: hypothetical protein AAGG38_04915 [Planctomycetota bacterium]
MTESIGPASSFVRPELPPADAYSRLVAYGRSHYPSAIWGNLPPIDVAADVVDAERWLRSEIADPRVTGVYLGFDTLNEEDGDGHNVEVGFTSDADPKSTDLGWIRKLSYGRKHLIRGIYELHSEYKVDFDELEGDDVELEQLEDLTIELDLLFYEMYGAIILMAAIQSVAPQESALFVWGMHDGDVRPLCRRSPMGFERIVAG